MDVMMPDMDGLEIMRNLKAGPKFAKIPVIMITGKSDEQAVSDSLKAGASNCVVKPFDRDTLIVKIDHAWISRSPDSRCCSSPGVGSLKCVQSFQMQL